MFWVVISSRHKLVLVLFFIVRILKLEFIHFKSAEHKTQVLFVIKLYLKKCFEFLERRLKIERCLKIDLDLELL